MSTNCCDYGCTGKGFNCPARETRGQLLAAERQWGETSQFASDEPDTDADVMDDMMRGVAVVLAVAVIGAAVGTAVYFY